MIVAYGLLPTLSKIEIKKNDFTGNRKTSKGGNSYIHLIICLSFHWGHLLRTSEKKKKKKKNLLRTSYEKQKDQIGNS